MFRSDVGNGAPPPGFDTFDNDHDDNAYIRALAESDTCDNSSCPRGFDEPATYTITVEAFDDGLEEFYDRNYRACAACNRACKKSFLGCRIKSRRFDNSVKDNRPRTESSEAHELPTVKITGVNTTELHTARRAAPVPGSVAYAREHPAGNGANNSPSAPASTTQAPPAHRFLTLYHHHHLPLSTLPPSFPCNLSDLLVSTPSARHRACWALR